jgi:hypothetical protein
MIGCIYQCIGRIDQRIGCIDARLGCIDQRIGRVYRIVRWNAGRHGQRAQQKQARNEFHVRRGGLCIVMI